MNTATTVHITDPRMLSRESRRKLITKLYIEVLRDNDPLFHFFYEPFLIVRITDDISLAMVCEILNKESISHITYGYPYSYCPDSCDERNSQIVADHGRDIFLPLFHAHSISALELSNADHIQYLERCIHTACNPRGIPRKEEGLILMELANAKLN